MSFADEIAAINKENIKRQTKKMSQNDISKVIDTMTSDIIETMKHKLRDEAQNGELHESEKLFKKMKYYYTSIRFQIWISKKNQGIDIVKGCSDGWDGFVDDGYNIECNTIDNINQFADMLSYKMTQCQMEYVEFSRSSYRKEYIERYGNKYFNKAIIDRCKEAIKSVKRSAMSEERAHVSFMLEFMMRLPS